MLVDAVLITDSPPLNLLSVTGLGSLAQLVQLKALALSDCRGLTDAWLAPLAGLTNLEVLWCRDNPGRCEWVGVFVRLIFELQNAAHTRRAPCPLSQP